MFRNYNYQFDLVIYSVAHLKNEITCFFLFSKHALVENPMNGLMYHYIYPADSRAVCLLLIFGWGWIIFYYLN